MARCQIVHAGLLWSSLFLFILLIPILCLALPLKGKTSPSVYTIVVVLFVLVWFYVTLQILAFSFMSYKRRCLGTMCIEFFKQKPKDINVWADYGLLLGLERDKNIVLGDTDLDLNLLKRHKPKLVEWLKTGLQSPLWYHEPTNTVYHNHNPFKIDFEEGVEDDDPFVHRGATLPLRGATIPVPERHKERLVSLYKDFWVKRPFAKDYDPSVTEKWRRLCSHIYRYLRIRF